MSSKRQNKSSSNRNNHRANFNNSQSNKNMGRRGPANQTHNGIYANKSMCHALTALVGAKCQIHVQNEDNLFEGFFHCFSPTMDLIVSAVHKVNRGSGDAPLKNEIVDDMIFPLNEVVAFTFENVDLSYAVEDSFTDNAISTKDQCKIDNDEKYNNLEEWQPDPEDGSQIDGDLGEVSSKMGGSGWTADEMFRTNQSKFDVKTTYDSKLTGYTVDLEKEDTQEFKERARRAHVLASQIEASVNYEQTIRHELDENIDDETKFSAVDETQQKEDQKGKYIPPSRRDVPTQSVVNGARVNKPNPSSSTRNMNTRPNAEAEKKRVPKNTSGQVQQAISQQSVSPISPGVKKGQEIKKENRNRSSPTQNEKNRLPPPQQRAPVPQRVSAPSQQNRAWNAIAAGNSDYQSNKQMVTGAQKMRNSVGNPVQQGAESGKKAEIAEMKSFGSNFILQQGKPEAEKIAQNLQTPQPSQTQSSTTVHEPSMQPKVTPSMHQDHQDHSQSAPSQSLQQPPPTTIKNRKTTPPPGMAPKPTGPPPGIQKDPKTDDKTEVSKKTTKLNPNAQEWRPNVSATPFKPSFTPKPTVQPTPIMTAQSPPVAVNQMPQQPQYLQQPPYHQQPMYPYQNYQQPQGFVQMPQQHIMHPQNPVTYAPTPQMSQSTVTQAPNQGPKQRPVAPGRPDNRIRHQPNQAGSPHGQPIGQASGIMQPGGQGSIMGSNLSYHPSPVNQQMIGVYQQEICSQIQHVGIQQRPFDHNYSGYQQQMGPQTPTSQGPGQVVYHSGHPNQPGPNQIPISNQIPGAAPGTIIHYQLAAPNGQQGMPIPHPIHYAPPRPQQMQPSGQGGYPQPGQHPQSQH